MSVSIRSVISTLGELRVRVRHSPDVRDLAADAWDRLAGTPEKRRLLARRAAFIGTPLAVILALVLWFFLRPVPKPDFDKDRIDHLFNYTLLTDEFNRLPIEERIDLLGRLVARIKNMGAGDSTLLAAFAAGIAGKAREQIEQNASRLAIDLWDKYAQDYQNVAPEDRNTYLDRTFIEFTKLMETVAGETRDISDDERLAEGRRQAQRDMQRAQEGRGPSGRFVGRAFTIMNNDVGGKASPLERARGAQLMRDMTRRLRGQGPN